MTDNDNATTMDPATVLRAAIEAAQKPIPQDGDNQTKTADIPDEPSNVHAHPALLRQVKTTATQDYFVTADPMIRRCDTAFGSGFEFS